MNKLITVFTLGFLTNSIVLRMSGKLPMDDIWFPVGLFIAMLLSLMMQSVLEGK